MVSEFQLAGLYAKRLQAEAINALIVKVVSDFGGGGGGGGCQVISVCDTLFPLNQYSARLQCGAKFTDRLSFVAWAENR